MHDWHPMLLKVFALASHTKISQRETTDLCSVLMKSNINSMDAFAALDGPTLKGMVRRMLTSDGWDCDRCMHIHRILERARMHPSVDHDGSFARLFHQVSRSLVADRPWMTHLPPNLLRFISACPDTSESDHLTGIAACMIQDRLVVGAGRERPRVVASCAHSLLRVVQVIVRLDPTAKFSEWLPRNASLSHLVAIAAKLMAFLNRRVYGRSHGTTHRIRTQAEVMLQHVTLMVRCGVFEPHTPVGAVLPMRQLHAKMFQLENSQPELYAATAQPHALWSKPELTTETLERLFTVARTCEEKAYLQLSAITGLRAGAIANLRLRAVWDAVKQEVVTVIAAMEKNSDLRRISTEAFPSLRSALHAFIVSNERQAAGGGPYLFPNRRCATVPSRGFASQTLRRLCRRANLPAHHHHQWRRMIVNTHMQRNGRLEDVAKWLGHRSPAITFAQRYFFLLFLQKGKGKDRCKPTTTGRILPWSSQQLQPQDSRSSKPPVKQ